MVLALVMIFIGQVSAKTLSISQLSSDKVSSMEFRDGGADGNIIEPDLSGYYPSVTFDEGLYIKCINPDVTYMYVSMYKDGSVVEKEIENWACYYTLEELGDVSSITIMVRFPRSIKINVADPSVVKFSQKDYYDSTPIEAVAGENIFKINEGNDFEIAVADPETHKLTRFYNVTTNSDYTVKNFQSSSVSSYYVYDGEEYAYEIVSADDFKMPVVKIRVDEPEEVTVKVGSTTVTGLVANEWKEVELGAFNEEITISNNDYNEEVYKVLLNGVPQTPSYSRFYVDVTDGDEVDVIVYPEAIDYTVNIKVVPEECAPVITRVSVAGEDAENTTGDFIVRNGKYIQIYFETSFYSLGDVTVNGEVVDDYIYSSYKYKVTGDADIVINATKNPVNTLIIDIDNPDAVDVTRYYDTIKLNPGENVVEYLPSRNRFSVDAKVGSTYHYFAYVKDGETIEVEDPGTSWSMSMDESVTKLIIEVSPIVLDKQFAVYLDIDQESLDKFYNQNSFGSFSFYSRNAGQSSYSTKVTPGYTVYDFADAYLPYYWTVSIYSDDNKAGFTDGKCFIDGELVEKEYTSWTLNEINDGAVIKCYILKDPATYTATITDDGEAEYSVIKDRIVEVTDLSTPISDLEDTEIQIIPAEDKAIKVTVSDGSDAVPVEVEFSSIDEKNGAYIIKLDGNKEIFVESEDLNGIRDVEMTGVSTAVYNMMGICVLRDATPEKIEALPAGIYVIGGKKIMKR